MVNFHPASGSFNSEKKKAKSHKGQGQDCRVDSQRLEYCAPLGAVL